MLPMQTHDTRCLSLSLCVVCHASVYSPLVSCNNRVAVSFFFRGSGVHLGSIAAHPWGGFLAGSVVLINATEPGSLAIADSWVVHRRGRPKRRDTMTVGDSC